MISMMVSQCPISSASETSQDLSPVLFRQSLYSPLNFLFTCYIMLSHAEISFSDPYCKITREHCSAGVRGREKSLKRFTGSFCNL